ncbi:hypothetical protein BU15DRAFT_60909 [Melanogaster broomeanus]|nr:hypothetical protein BU15DRAFT_60909 [Melanogaster broomeanus]
MTNAEKPFVNKPLSDNNNNPDSDSDEAGYRPESPAGYRDDAEQSSDPLTDEHNSVYVIQKVLGSRASNGGINNLQITGSDPHSPPRQFSTDSYTVVRNQQPNSDKNKGNKK